jgi:hypothetical protein
MDLETLIGDADPARDLIIPPPETQWARQRVASAPTPSVRAGHRRAHQRPRRSLARTAVIVGVALAGMSGTAMAIGVATGVIDLGGGQSAQPVHTSLGPGDPNLPYRYRIDGLPADRDGTGPVYIESTRPLKTDADGRIDVGAILAARRACLPDVKSVGGATIWVFDASCDSAQP